MIDPRWESQLTKQAYGATPRIDGVEIVALKEFADDGGAFLELGRFTDGTLQGVPVRQVNYSVVAPGAVKATHLHNRQTDFWFVPSHDRLLVGLKDVRAGSPTVGVTMRFVLGAGAPRIVRIPPGVAHGVANPYERPMALIYLVSEYFNPDPAACDELRLPPDCFGEHFWDIAAG